MITMNIVINSAAAEVVTEINKLIRISFLQSTVDCWTVHIAKESRSNFQLAILGQHS